MDAYPPTGRSLANGRADDIGGPWRALGVDVGGTKTAASVVDHAGSVLSSAVGPTDATDPEALVAAIVDVARRALDDAGLAAGAGGAADSSAFGVVDAVGVGLPAQIETDGTVPHCTNLPYLVGSDIVRCLGEAFGVPAAVENDAGLAALGEALFGAQRTDSLVLLTLGTGVGGGVVIGGRPYLGPHGSAGELGHMVMVVDGPECPCGQRGCIEALIAGPFVAARARAAMTAPGGDSSSLWAVAGAPDGVGAEDVVEAARAQDPLAMGVIARTGEYLGTAMSTLANVFAPKRMVLGGGLGEAAADLLLPIARTVVERDALAGSVRGLTIAPAGLGRKAGVVGAAAFAIQSMHEEK